MSQGLAEVRFYSTRDEYGYFSNFAAASIRLKDKVWSTTEHYFQAQKFAGTAHVGLLAADSCGTLEGERHRERRRRNARCAHVRASGPSHRS